MMKPHNNGTCHVCGGTKLTLAQDETHTHYTDYEFKGGKFVAANPREECPNPEDGDTRFFCSACGEYMVVPEELLK